MSAKRQPAISASMIDVPAAPAPAIATQAKGDIRPVQHRSPAPTAEAPAAPSPAPAAEAVPAPEPQPEAKPAAGGRPKLRGELKSLTLKLDLPRYRKLQLMGVDEGSSHQDLLLEAFDLLLEERRRNPKTSDQDAA